VIYEIRPLEWELFMDGTCAEAKPISGHRYVAMGWAWCYQLASVCGDIAGDKCDTLEAAKAACEADWRARIAVCLAPVAWMPIETAPKDREAVLLWCPERKNIQKCWWRDGAWQRNNDTLMEEPTHWQPLPAPPEVNK
jgi:hypothetical protein